jgi:SAM-dependent methyltransferase
LIDDPGEEEIMSDPQANPGYVDPELLRAIYRKLEPFKRRAYELLALQPGEWVLDAGCGSGLDTTALAPQVGIEGQIIGVDHDPEMVDAANERAAALGLSEHCVHRRGDVTALAFEAGTFDAVHCDRVLQHVRNSARAIYELVRVLKPGGRLVLFEPDWSTLSIDAPDRDLELEWRLRRFFTDRLGSGYVGRQVWRWMVKLGLQQIQLEPVAIPFTRYPEVRLILIQDRIEREALETGLATPEALERWRSDCWAADAAGTFYASLVGMLACGVKPRA